MMKKLVSLCLTAAMLLSLVPAVFAAEDEGLKAAILGVKERIEIPDTYTQFYSDLSASENGEKTYSLTWEKPGDEWDGSEQLQVSVNEKQDILYYRNSAAVDYSGEVQFPVYMGDELKERAASWLSGINADWMPELPEDAVTTPGRGGVQSPMASVSFSRRVSGLPYCGDHVRIQLNNRTGEIASMYASWSYETPAYLPEDALSTEEANAAFLTLSPMELVYERGEGESNASLVYRPSNGSLRLNARTGEEFNAYTERYRAENFTESAADAAPMVAGGGAEKGLSEQELRNLEQVQGLLSEEVLRAKAEAIANTGIKDAAFGSIAYRSYREDEEDELAYRAELQYYGKNDSHFSLTMDAQSGELLSYWSYGGEFDGADAKTRFPAKEAAARAEAFLRDQAGEEFAHTTAPDMDEEASEDENGEPSFRDYNLSYIREENGIPFDENNLYLQLDGRTGRIESFYKNWDDALTFDSPDGIISAEQAAEALLTAHPLTLAYAKAEPEQGKEALVDLQYQLSAPYCRVDAKSGELKGSDWDKDTSASPSDLSGHYAEAQILRLFETGVLTLGEGEADFRPDARITQKELLGFVCGLRNGYVPYYDLPMPELAREAGIYDRKGAEIEPDAPVTRERAVQLIIDALGYQSIAKLTGIFRTAFADESEITSEALGYVALAQGLKLVGGDENGCFQPHTELTRADAALMIYNYLNR